MRGELQTGEDSEAELHLVAALSLLPSPHSPKIMLFPSPKEGSQDYVKQSAFVEKSILFLLS